MKELIKGCTTAIALMGIFLCMLIIVARLDDIEDYKRRQLDVAQSSNQQLIDAITEFKNTNEATQRSVDDLMSKYDELIDIHREDLEIEERAASLSAIEASLIEREEELDAKEDKLKKKEKKLKTLEEELDTREKDLDKREKAVRKAEKKVTKTSSTSNYTGIKLTKSAGIIMGPSGKETYYNLPMGTVVKYMKQLGYNYQYWERDDGVKMFGNYVMVAADLSIRPKGTLVSTSLGTGIVCDTGTFIYSNKTQIDIAVTW